MTELKRVSFAVAKAIREAGYPQGDKNSGNDYCYPLVTKNINYSPYVKEVFSLCKRR